MSEIKFLKVSVTGLSTPKGCRKPRRYFDELTRLETLEQLDETSLIKQALEYVSRKNKVESCRIVVNKASQDGEIVMVQLLPIKTIEVKL